MAEVLLLAPWVSSAGVVYGPGHKLPVNDPDLTILRSTGKADLLSPQVRSVGITALGTTTATIQWVIDTGSILAANVEYGTTTGYGSTATGGPLPGPGVMTANLTGLTTGTLYNFRVISVSSFGLTNYGFNQTFRTL